MKLIPGHARNINGVTPIEAIAPVSRAEEQRIDRGLMRVTPAQLALESTIQLRVLPVHEKYMPKLTIREHKQVTEFAKWFFTLGRATSLVIDTENIDRLDCSRYDRMSTGHYSRKPGIDNNNHWYDENWDKYNRVTRTEPLARATLQLCAIATLPEYDDITVRVRSENLMLSAPNSPLEKSGVHGFNMVYMEEL